MAENTNLFALAQEYYLSNPQKQDGSKKRALAVKELMLVIETAPFLSKAEKEQNTFLIPLYSLPVIEKVKHSLIRQGIIFLQLNPNQKAPVEKWLTDVSFTPAKA